MTFIVCTGAHLVYSEIIWVSWSISCCYSSFCVILFAHTCEHHILVSVNIYTLNTKDDLIKMLITVTPISTDFFKLTHLWSPFLFKHLFFRSPRSHKTLQKLYFSRTILNNSKSKRQTL